MAAAVVYIVGCDGSDYSNHSTEMSNTVRDSVVSVIEVPLEGVRDEYTAPVGADE